MRWFRNLFKRNRHQTVPWHPAGAYNLGLGMRALDTLDKRR